jgi:hypothetical protein
VITYHVAIKKHKSRSEAEPVRFNEIETGSKPLIWCAFSLREPVSTPHQVRGSKTR